MAKLHVYTPFRTLDYFSCPLFPLARHVSYTHGYNYAKPSPPPVMHVDIILDTREEPLTHPHHKLCRQPDSETLVIP